MSFQRNGWGWLVVAGVALGALSGIAFSQMQKSASPKAESSPLRNASDRTETLVWTEKQKTDEGDVMNLKLVLKPENKSPDYFVISDDGTVTPYPWEKNPLHLSLPIQMHREPTQHELALRSYIAKMDESRKNLEEAIRNFDNATLNEAASDDGMAFRDFDGAIQTALLNYFKTWQEENAAIDLKGSNIFNGYNFSGSNLDIVRVEIIKGQDLEISVSLPDPDGKDQIFRHGISWVDNDGRPCLDATKQTDCLQYGQKGVTQ